MTCSKLARPARTAASLLLLSVIPACSTAPIKPKFIPLGDYSYARAYTADRIENLMAEHGLPGFAVALIDDQTTVWQEAFGLANVEEGTPITTGTTFRVGSISKLFTAIEIMRLSEEGLIDLDAPITEYVPDFSIKSRFPNADPITIRSILAHRSGLPRNGNLPLWYWDPGVDVLQETVASLKDSHAAFPPGHRYKYSNVGYVLLGRIIETTKGVLYPFHMKSDLLDPIGMKNSAFLLDGIADPETVATGHSPSDGKTKPLNQYDIINMPSGNLYSTVEDLCEFARFVFRGGVSGGRQLIRQDSLEAMFEVQFAKPRDPQQLGLGWFTDHNALPEKVVFHSGTCHGTISFFALIPEKKLGVIFISNSQAFEDLAPPLVFEVLELILETKCGITPRGSFCGTYIVDGEVMRVVTRGSKLKALARGREVDLVPLSNRKFRLKHWLADIGRIDVEFFAGDEDEADIMLLTIEGSYFITCPKYPPIEDAPPLWHKLAGKYRIHTRVASNYSDADVLGEAEIGIVDNVLVLPNLKAALWPINETEILLIGGIYDGETMQYDQETGTLTHQSAVYRKLRSEED